MSQATICVHTATLRGIEAIPVDVEWEFREAYLE